MDRATYEREAAVNRKAYEALRDRIRREYAGQYVALAQGRLVAAALDFDEARAAIHRLEPEPEVYFIFPAEREPDFGLANDISEFPAMPRRLCRKAAGVTISACTRKPAGRPRYRTR
jgi:hypothetical protein